MFVEEKQRSDDEEKVKMLHQHLLEKQNPFAVVVVDALFEWVLQSNNFPRVLLNLQLYLTTTIVQGLC